MPLTLLSSPQSLLGTNWKSAHNKPSGSWCSRSGCSSEPAKDLYTFSFRYLLSSAFSPKKVFCCLLVTGINKNWNFDLHSSFSLNKCILFWFWNHTERKCQPVWVFSLFIFLSINFSHFGESHEQQQNRQKVHRKIGRGLLLNIVKENRQLAGRFI